MREREREGRNKRDEREKEREMRPIIDSNFDCILSQATTTVLQAPLEGKIELHFISLDTKRQSFFKNS